ncbi:CTDP1 [Branchiostoma lanceolatum]|uniref:RNA polymerase II subunit A C-terminal domain phosphatase n=1 Tax=Branchiostoma lanceolatum TaxID=7740 RepID=A0A8K0ELN1_BRALA|nr:CTDP1 [Branchiostoma lanceolatum]
MVAEDRTALLDIEAKCLHRTVIWDMCAECGEDLRKDDGPSGRSSKPGSPKPADTTAASVSMVHTVPGLRVTQEEARLLAQREEKQLLDNRKLVLMVDLDQTLIHSAQEPVDPRLVNGVRDIYTHGSRPEMFTRLRPHTSDFLEYVSQFYELHVFSFGNREYAHKVATFLDPKGKLFYQRILSRDESEDLNRKNANLRSLFPCGDSMVAIIDDRADVWDDAPNLVRVKKYEYFMGVGDVNDPNASPLRQVKAKQPANSKAEVGKPEETPEDKPSNSKEKAAKPDNTAEEKSANSKREEAKSDETAEEKQENTEQPTNSKEELDNKPGDPTVEENDKGEDKQGGNNKDLSDTKDKTAALQDDGKGKDDVIESAAQDKMEVTSHEEEINASSDGKDQKQTVNDTSKTEAGDISSKEGEGKNPEVGAERKEDKSASSNSEKDTMETTTTETAEAKQQTDAELEFESEEVGHIDEDDYLLHLQDILVRIHHTFYEAYDKYKAGSLSSAPDVKLIAPFLRKQTLRGSVLLFSGVIPTNIVPEKSPEFRAATLMGARVARKFIPPGKDGGPEQDKGGTTHLVAANLRTEKARMIQEWNSTRGRGSQVCIVDRSWLWCCWERWEHVDERIFPVLDSSPAERENFNAESVPLLPTGEGRPAIAPDAQPTNTDVQTALNVPLTEESEDRNVGLEPEQDSDRLEMAQAQNQPMEIPPTTTQPAVPQMPPEEVATYDPLTGKRVRRHPYMYQHYPYPPQHTMYPPVHGMYPTELEFNHPEIRGDNRFVPHPYPEKPHKEQSSPDTEEPTSSRGPRKRRLSTIAETNPLMAFSSEDIANMDKEVEEAFSEDSDSESEGEGGRGEREGDRGEDSRSSLSTSRGSSDTGPNKKRKREEEDGETRSSMASSSSDSEADEMAAALEAEFF